MGRIIGIDLGTTNSLAAVWENGQSVLIPNAWGEVLTPSVVSIDEYNMAHVGWPAWERLFTHPANTAASFKRHMGTKRIYSFSGWEYKPEELSALILKRLKEDAESYLGEKVTEAVISVPAYFDDRARRATRNAGLLAGLKVSRIVNEPSAAALACRNFNQEDEETMIVFDFGGGTLDVSLVDCFDNIIEIAAVSGDNQLGGNDFDTAIAMEFCRTAGVPFIKLSGECKAALLHEARECKMRLGESQKTQMRIDMPELRHEVEFSEKDLIRISSEIFVRMEKPVRDLLQRHRGIYERAPDKLIAVGGSCQMPVVQTFLKNLFQETSLELVEPQHIVAKGMGVYAGIRERKEEIKDLLLTDVNPFSIKTFVYGHKGAGQLINVIGQNAALPASRIMTLRTLSDQQKSIRLKIYQGTGGAAEEYHYLGKLKLNVPPGPAGAENVTVKFSYDIDGLLLAEARVDSTGEIKQKIIASREFQISEENLMQGIAKLNRTKVHPRDQEANQWLLERAGKLLEKAHGALWEDLQDKLSIFDRLLKSQEELKLMKWRKYFTEYLDRLEECIDGEADEMIDFERWYEEHAEESDL